MRLLIGLYDPFCSDCLIFNVGVKYMWLLLAVLVPLPTPEFMITSQFLTDDCIFIWTLLQWEYLPFVCSSTLMETKGHEINLVGNERDFALLLNH